MQDVTFHEEIVRLTGSSVCELLVITVTKKENGTILHGIINTKLRVHRHCMLVEQQC